MRVEVGAFFALSKVLSTRDNTVTTTGTLHRVLSRGSCCHTSTLLSFFLALLSLKPVLS